MAYDWQSQLAPLEQAYGIPHGLLGALIRAESGGNANALSPVGAIGYGQLMPATAASLGVNPHDPAQNLKGTAMYLSQNLKSFGGDVNKTLAAYNAGPNAVRKYNGIPPYKETQDYVKRVNGYWSEVAGHGTASPSVPAGTQQTAAQPAPVVYPTRQVVAGATPANLARIQNAYVDDPTIGNAKMNGFINQQTLANNKYQTAMQKAQQTAASNPLPAGSYNAYQASGTTPTTGAAVGAKFFKTPNGFVATRRPGEYDYQFLQRLGTKGFGLANDPGNGQTTGGSHAAKSYHYRNGGEAVDFGTGRNSMSLLNQWYTYLNANRKALGVAELLHEDPGTSNEHIHVASTL